MAAGGAPPVATCGTGAAGWAAGGTVAEAAGLVTGTGPEAAAGGLATGAGAVDETAGVFGLAVAVKSVFTDGGVCGCGGACVGAGA